MPTLLTLSTPDGPIHVEVSNASGSMAPVGNAERVIDGIDASMTSAFRLVRSVSLAFTEAVKGLPASSAELELGLKFTAKGTVFVVETQGEASLKVKLIYEPLRTL